MEFPTALLGVALGTVLLPSLSKANAQNDLNHAGELLIWGLQLTFLLAAPCALTLFIFGEPLAAVLYHYGKFNALDVFMTQRALAAHGVAVLMDSPINSVPELTVSMIKPIISCNPSKLNTSVLM